MSADTKAAIEDAIRAHVGDEYPDSLLGSFVVILERVPIEEDGYTHIVDVVPDGQSNVTSLGLSTFLSMARGPAR